MNPNDLFKNVVMTFQANDVFTKLWAEFGFSVPLEYDGHFETLICMAGALQYRYINLPNGKRVMTYCMESVSKHPDVVEAIVKKLAPPGIIDRGELNRMEGLPFLQCTRKETAPAGSVPNYYKKWMVTPTPTFPVPQLEAKSNPTPVLKKIEKKKSAK